MKIIDLSAAPTQIYRLSADPSRTLTWIAGWALAPPEVDPPVIGEDAPPECWREKGGFKLTHMTPALGDDIPDDTCLRFSTSNERACVSLALNLTTANVDVHHALDGHIVHYAIHASQVEEKSKHPIDPIFWSPFRAVHFVWGASESCFFRFCRDPENSYSMSGFQGVQKSVIPKLIWKNWQWLDKTPSLHVNYKNGHFPLHIDWCENRISTIGQCWNRVKIRIVTDRLTKRGESRKRESACFWELISLIDRNRNDRLTKNECLTYIQKRAACGNKAVLVGIRDEEFNRAWTRACEVLSLDWNAAGRKSGRASERNSKSRY